MTSISPGVGTMLRRTRRPVNHARLLRQLLPALSMALIIAAIYWLNPRAISYFGFSIFDCADPTGVIAGLDRAI